MQNADITNKIDQFGNLIREIQYWHRLAEDEGSVQSFEYCESMFIETLEQAREMQPYLIAQLDSYFKECNETNTPIDLNYYRISKELKSYSF